MASASDNFNRANEDPLSGGGNWAAFATQARPRIVSNQVVSNGAADCYTRYTGISWTADQASEFKLTSSLGALNDRAGVLCRAAAGSSLHGYTFYVQRDAGPTYNIFLHKWVGGVSTGIATASYGGTPASGDILRLEVMGTSLVGKINGSTRISATDGAVTAADSPGFFVGVNLAVDDWAGEDIQAVQTPPPAALALSGSAPTVQAPVSASPSAGSASISGFAPTVARETRIPSAGAVGVSGNAALLGLSALPGAGSLSLTGAAPIAAAEILRQPLAAPLALSGGAAEAVVPLDSLRDEWQVLRKYVTVLTDHWTVVPTRFSSSLRDEWTVLQTLAPLRDEWRVYPDKLEDLFAEDMHEPRALATIS